MKRASFIYRVLLVWVGASALVTFARINKVNFYHHYYRVIEDVQDRNSQEWEAVVHLGSYWEAVFSTFSLSPLPFTSLFSLEAVPTFRRLHLIRFSSHLHIGIWYHYASPAQAP